MPSLSSSLLAWSIFALALASGSARADEACALVPAAAPDMPAYIEAVVVGPSNDADVLSQTRIAIERTHAPVSPAYVNLPRVNAVYRSATGVEFMTIAAVISGPLPPRGAHVTLATRHRDPNAPCAFIPWTVVEKGSGT
jgi:hypothetical protein